MDVPKVNGGLFHVPLVIEQKRREDSGPSHIVSGK
jgi:hypothetical protein